MSNKFLNLKRKIFPIEIVIIESFFPNVTKNENLKISKILWLFFNKNNCRSPTEILSSPNYKFGNIWKFSQIRYSKITIFQISKKTYHPKSIICVWSMVLWKLIDFSRKNLKSGISIISDLGTFFMIFGTEERSVNTLYKIEYWKSKSAFWIFHSLSLCLIFYVTEILWYAKFYLHNF